MLRSEDQAPMSTMNRFEYKIYIRFSLLVNEKDRFLFRISSW